MQRPCGPGAGLKTAYNCHRGRVSTLPDVGGGGAGASLLKNTPAWPGGRVLRLPPARPSSQAVTRSGQPPLGGMRSTRGRHSAELNMGGGPAP